MTNRIRAICLASFLVGTSAAAQAPLSEDRDAKPQHVRVELASFRFTPPTIALQAGRSYVLEFENRSGSSHDFTAREFFAAAQMSADERAKINHGEVELKGHQSTEISLTPTKVGDFEFHCGHPMHSIFGMKGRIHVG